MINLSIYGRIAEFGGVGKGAEVIAAGSLETGNRNPTIFLPAFLQHGKIALKGKRCPITNGQFPSA
jgi:hypothetical protein